MSEVEVRDIQKPEAGPVGVDDVLASNPAEEHSTSQGSIQTSWDRKSMTHWKQRR